ncbi:MAG: YceI family protein [Bacteroidia bacterium]|nr:YceI family protein [Bacteroidia bacterium]
MKRLSSITLLLISFLMSATFAQTTFKANENTEVKVTGTSTLHDWHANVKETKAEGVMIVTGNGLTALTSLKVSMKVESMDTGEKMMDKNLYKALKSEANPYITYKLKEVKSITPSSGGYSLNTLGTLTIAGITKTVNLTVKAKVNTDGSVTFTGSHKLDMVEYQVEPPVAVFGTIKTGKDVTIEFKLTLSQIAS